MPGVSDPADPVIAADGDPNKALIDLAGTRYATGAHVTATAFLGRTLAIALGDGIVRLVPPEGGEAAGLQVHDGAVLGAALADEGKALITGGDDGRVCRISQGGAVDILFEKPGKWIDSVAAASWGAVAWAAGKAVYVMTPRGDLREIPTQSSVQGLAFSVKGRLLAIPQYNAVWILDLARTGGEPKSLQWNGAHIAATFSPNGRFLVSAMQENALHLWRLEDGVNAQMAGFPGKPTAFSWSPGGAWMACSGAGGPVLWPFKGKDGPMGKQAVTLAPRDALVTAVASHPVSDVTAAGYDNGTVIFARRADEAAFLVRRGDEDPITAVTFDQKGGFFAYGTEAGEVGRIDLGAASRD